MSEEETAIVYNSATMDQPTQSLSPLSEHLVTSIQKKETVTSERKITVNPFVSKVASWYEKLRNAMEYREDEVILRSTIERILKRRLLLGGNAKTTAEPLVRELIWARYLPDNGVPVSAVTRVEEAIDLFLTIRLQVLQNRKLSDGTLNEWTYHLLSSELATILSPNKQEDLLASYMYQLLRGNVTIVDESEQTRDAQVYIAVRKAFAHDDLAFLRYHMFLQIFGEITEKKLERIIADFPKARREIERQLNFPSREKIFAFVKRNTPPFLILADIFRRYNGKITELLKDQQAFEKEVYQTCSNKYHGTAAKVQRAIIRSVLFILFSKLIFAFLVEGTYERIFYHRIIWTSIAVNTGIPPLMMIVVSLFIQTPGSDNTKRIYAYIKSILYEDKPNLWNPIVVRKKRVVKPSIQRSVFTILWLLAFLLTFGGIIYILTLLHFNIISQGVFIFFLAIVSFLSYRISLTAHIYRLGDTQGLLTPFIDFLFLPIVQVGRRLTQGISQINILIFVFDLFIETPFKVVFAFFEQWFYFLHPKREELE